MNEITRNIVWNYVISVLLIAFSTSAFSGCAPADPGAAFRSKFLQVKKESSYNDVIAQLGDAQYMRNMNTYNHPIVPFDQLPSTGKAQFEWHKPDGMYSVLFTDGKVDRATCLKTGGGNVTIEDVDFK